MAAENDNLKDLPALSELKARPYVRPAVAWEDSLDIKSLAAGCAKAAGSGCEVFGTTSS